MRLLVIVAIVSVGCSSKSSEPPKGNDYCRGRATYTAVPATPLSGAQGSSIPAHTFSIVARDPATGDLGVAVQSHWFSVGSAVTWAEPGVGAVATQSFVDKGYGPKGLALMASGVAPAEALAQLVAADKQAAVRQVGFVDATGRAAAHTGAKAIDFAGHHVGEGFAVQANLMGNDKVVPAMRDAYQASKGDLAERMLAALDAAQAVGGDIRGCQSAAILIVSGKKTDAPWNERKMDLRVEEHADPLVELRRLVVNMRAYDRVNQGDLAMEKQDVTGALAHYDAGMKILPDNTEIKYWVGVTLASLDRVDEALPLFRAAFKDDPAWIELTRRLTKPGLIPDTDKGRAAVERILREAK
ncbi:MAG: DUF1028 domain-containing protein [Myxococcota bacterium]|nr:DUF1028 domain-containing protein [Myxococcota bacterium]